MKKYEIAIMSIALLLNSSVIMAGAITDIYTKGDVLSASKLDNIKTAVNDNNNASRFYGDGSAGPLTISATTDWNATPPAADNLNFTNVVIDAGSTLTVPAGTVIRCTGTFTNNGTIIVSDANNSENYFGAKGESDARRPASKGEYSLTLGNVLGGFGGKAIPRAVAASSFNHLTIGGGAGAGEGSQTGSGIGNGGGLIKIYCLGSIINANNIQANGNDGLGNGGGGGGIIILASSTSITNTGAINAKGGDGSTVSDSSGAPGGGGGGIIALVSPVINTSTSTLFVNGGLAGSSGGIIPTPSHTAGNGGGASGGNGGNGGAIDGAGVKLTAGAGLVGYVLQIGANPAGMMN